MLVKNAASEKNILDPKTTSVESLITVAVQTAIKETQSHHDPDRTENTELLNTVGQDVLNLYFSLTNLNSVQMSYCLVPILTTLEGVGDKSGGEPDAAYRVLPFFASFIEKYNSHSSVEIAAAGQTLLQSFDSDLHAHLCSCFQRDEMKHVAGDNRLVSNRYRAYEERSDEIELLPSLRGAKRRD